MANHHPADGGGHTTYLIELARRLSATHEIIIAAPISSKLNKLAKNIENIQVMDIDFPGTLKEPVRLFSAIYRLAQLINNLKIDVIHVNGSPDHRIIMYTSWLLGRKLPVIFTKHNTLPSLSFGNRIRSKHTSAVISVCKSLTSTLSTSAYKNIPIYTIENGVDIDYFLPVTQNILTNKDPSKIIFSSVAGTPLYKGWQYMVEAMSLIPIDIRKSTMIVIAGENPTNEIKEKYVERLGMSAHVSFTGVVSDVRKVIADSDVGFVLSDGVETISFACREMMSMGKPVIVSDYSGLSENIDDDINGWITKTGDIESIRIKILWIINNHEKIKAMGEYARLKAVKEFSIQDFIKKTEYVYAKVANNFKI